MRTRKVSYPALFLFAVCTSVDLAASAASEIVLKNPHLSLGFDGQTGAWIGLVDGRTGDELVAGPVARSMVMPLTAPRLDEGRIRQAVTSGQAIDLSSGWQYAAAPEDAKASAAIVQGRFDAVKWQPTTIPSRRGTGDDRLHERNGDFFYRREFTLPQSWTHAELMLVLGAVDDFDVTYVNGTRIGSTGRETPEHWQAPRLYRVPDSLLRRDKPNVLLVKATNAGFDGGLDGPAVLGFATALRQAEPAGAPLVEHSLKRRSGASVLDLVTKSDGYEYRMEYVLPDDRSSFSRQLAIRNISGKERVLQNAVLPTPPLCVGPKQAAIFPGTLPVGDNAVAGLQDGETLGTRSEESLGVLWDGEKQRGIGAWYHSEEEWSPITLRRSGPGAEIRHTQRIIIRLQPGEAVKLGKQHFWLSHGPRSASLEGIQQVYREIGLHAPDRGLTNLREMVLYCGHPGGPPELNYRTYGGFRALQTYLPTLKKMNIDLLWLLPIWEHGDGKVWNLYSPFDHFKVSPIYGTPEELKRLSSACSDCGMRLMFDLVPHGPPDFTPLAKEHPEWICREVDGKLHYEWSQYAFDNHHPGWQDYMRRAAQWHGKEFGAIGARVDCGAGSAPNWNPAMGNRPSLSTLAGGLGMNLAIREGFLKSHHEVVILPEEYTGANLFYRVGDLTYDAQLYFLLCDLQSRDASPEQWAASLAQFLHDQKLTLPPGALKMRWISNHDTVSWTFQKQRPMKAYGVPKMRALMAFCALVDGVPMLYQGDEDPAVYGGKGESNVDFLAKLYGIRKQTPAIRQGQADYMSVRSTGGVFACLRESPGQRAVVLISLNPARVESTVSAPAELAGSWRDVFSEEKLELGPSRQVSMGPYQIRVLVR